MWWNYFINFSLGIIYDFDRDIVNEGSVLSQKVHMPSVTSRRHVSCMEHVPTSHHVTEPEGFINKQSVVSFLLINFFTFIFSSGGIINIKECKIQYFLMYFLSIIPIMTLEYTYSYKLNYGWKKWQNTWKMRKVHLILVTERSVLAKTWTLIML